MPGSKDDINDYLNTNIDGIILPIERLSVNSSCYFNILEVRDIVNNTDKEVIISVNKVMMNSDLALLEDVLVACKDMGITKVIFYDIAVMELCKRLGLDMELIVFQDHLNVSVNSNMFYKKRGVKYSLISNDITLDEINDISKVQSLMMICYGYLPMFYSRRYLISNYLKYIDCNENNSEYFIDDGKDKYRIVEEDGGTTIYSKNSINLIDYVKELDVDYVILNGNYIDRDKFFKTIDCYVNDKLDDSEKYLGFLNKETVYKVEDYE